MLIYVFHVSILHNWIQRSNSITEKLLVNWIAVVMYPFLKVSIFNLSHEI